MAPLAVGFRDPFVIDGTQIFRPQQAKSELLFPRRRIKGDGNVDETETDAVFPNCAHTQLFRTASRICADEDADLAPGGRCAVSVQIVGHDGACPSIAILRC